MNFKKKTVLLPKIILLVVLVAGLLVGLSQIKNNVTQDIRSKAGGSCLGLVKYGPLKNEPGVINSIDYDKQTLVWGKTGSSLLYPVETCADTKITRRKLGGLTKEANDPMSFSELKQWDGASITGFYKNASKTTIVAELIRDTSVSYITENNGKVSGVVKDQQSGKVTRIDFYGENRELAPEKLKYYGMIAVTNATVCTNKLNTSIDCSSANPGDTISFTGSYGEEGSGIKFTNVTKVQLLNR